MFCFNDYFFFFKLFTDYVNKWSTFAVKFYEKYKVDESFQSIIHNILELYEQYQKELETVEKEDAIVPQPILQQSSTETDELISPDKSLQIEEAFVLEEALISQPILHQQQSYSNSMDPLMSSTIIKEELSERIFCSYDDSVAIIELSPEKPIVIEDSFVIGFNSQTNDTEESIIGKAEREARKGLDDLQFE